MVGRGLPCVPTVTMLTEVPMVLSYPACDIRRPQVPCRQAKPREPKGNLACSPEGLRHDDDKGPHLLVLLFNQQPLPRPTPAGKSADCEILASRHENVIKYGPRAENVHNFASTY